MFEATDKDRASLWRHDESERDAPSAAAGGPLALVEENDLITVDAEARRLNPHVDDGELARRRAAWRPRPAPREAGGVLAKYARLVSSSSLGAVTDADV